MNETAQIKKIFHDDLRTALDLVNTVFVEFVAKDYLDEGKKTFENYLKTKYDEIYSEIESGSKT